MPHTFCWGRWMQAAGHPPGGVCWFPGNYTSYLAQMSRAIFHTQEDGRISISWCNHTLNLQRCWAGPWAVGYPVHSYSKFKSLFESSCVATNSSQIQVLDKGFSSDRWIFHLMAGYSFAGISSFSHYYSIIHSGKKNTRSAPMLL